MWPLVGYSNPNKSFTVVDFPEPLGPSRPKTSPRRTSKSTLSTARAFGRPQKSLKTLVRPRTEMTTSPLLFWAGATGLVGRVRGMGRLGVLGNALSEKIGYAASFGSSSRRGAG